MTRTITSQVIDLSCRITLYMVTVSTNFDRLTDLAFGQNCRFCMVSDYSLLSDRYWIQQSLTYECACKHKYVTATMCSRAEGGGGGGSCAYALFSTRINPR
jgi:hypothetical protein